jgi:hypothetical protein
MGLLTTTLLACSVFGSSDDAPAAPSDPALPPPSTPQDNAKPPPVGGTAPVGVYVSSSQGADDGSGSSVRPLKTLASAFALAKEKGLRVIACAEEYPENLTLVDGVSAYGYYDCKKTPWERGAPRAVVRAPATPAVVATGLTQPTRLEGVEIRSPDLDAAPATDTAGTSIALEVRATTGLTLSEVLLHAGKGAPGTDGVEGPLNSRTATSNGAAGINQTVRTCNPAIQQCDALRVLGPAGGTTTCAIGPAGGAGGKAGDGRWYASGVESTATVEYRGLPLVATAQTAVGGLNANALNISNGLPGTPGARGAEGKDGVNGLWSLLTTGFVRGNGTAGEAGQPGQGGGGAAGTKAAFYSNGAGNPPLNGYYATSTGGSGAAGGCAGQPGTPATGGGASIGALVIDSALALDGVRIESSAGGAAGKGNLGQPGTTGGTGGAPTINFGSASTGAGGDGGAGGSGGASGHGAPGPSIALAWSKTKPTMTKVDLVPGPAGAGQPELTRLVGGTVGTKVLAAVTGESKMEHEITK